MNGGATFNEVFFDDVRVPDENVLGDVNEGWTVAITTLMNERVAIGSGGGGGGRGTRRRPHRARAAGAASNGDPLVRQRLADLYTKTRIQKFLVDAHAHRRARRARCPGPKVRSASCSAAG